MPTVTNFRWKNGWRSAVAARRLKNLFATGRIPKSAFKRRRKQSRNLKNDAMKRVVCELVALFAAANLTALSSQVSPGPNINDEPIALVGGTVISPADGKIIRN